MKSICGINCDECDFARKCEGCKDTDGCPFGKKCFVADYIKAGGVQNYSLFKDKLIKEFNELNIPGMPRIKELYPLKGSFVNLEYNMPSGKKEKLLDDDSIYLGSQVECEFNDEAVERCYGIVADPCFLLVCEYGVNGKFPEIVLYKRR